MSVPQNLIDVYLRARPFYQQILNAQALHPAQRPGQVMYNYVLPPKLADSLCGSFIDPFQISTLFELVSWIDNHLILDDEGRNVLAAFHNDLILWEA